MNEENRRFARHGVPTIIYAPELTDLCIAPIDISGGGFKAIFDEEPTFEDVATCEIHVFGEVFEGCKISVAWTMPLNTAVPSFLVAFKIEEFDGVKRAQAAIEGLNSLMKFG